MVNSAGIKITTGFWDLLPHHWSWVYHREHIEISFTNSAIHSSLLIWEFLQSLLQGLLVDGRLILLVYLSWCFRLLIKPHIKHISWLTCPVRPSISRTIYCLLSSMHRSIKVLISNHLTESHVMRSKASAALSGGNFLLFFSWTLCSLAYTPC